ncbi:hypothetical protein [Streptantibioticus ferralitis]|uniref:Uncharacterized protein n=1 Tax=Streptantibioticus ferralitis TaxID=236510 RepID=A0ABT5YTP7_9ACTN|nr:hypothetical protein [Streptantibioticus ferralitis]MDF2254976.1 hypothetical protein [Streptantibioticus ferralitis]
MSAPSTAAGSGVVNAEQTGKRLEAVLDRLAQGGDPTVSAAAEELVRILMDFYGAGLARAVDLVAAAGQSGGPLAALLGDELVASLLVLHDLHPEDTMTRIARAVNTVAGRPFELAGLDKVSGVLRLRPAASSGCGCGNTAQAAKEQVEAALSCFAPEVTAVEVEPAQGGASEPKLLNIGPTRTRSADPEPQPAEAR